MVYWKRVIIGSTLKKSFEMSFFQTIFPLDVNERKQYFRDWSFKVHNVNVAFWDPHIRAYEFKEMNIVFSC